jgi:acetate kinase
MKILVCNSGSSSLKVSLFDADRELLLAEGHIDWTPKPTRLVFRRPGQPALVEELDLCDHSEALARILTNLQPGPSAPLLADDEIHSVGHRVVHGEGSSPLPADYARSSGGLVS